MKDIFNWNHISDKISKEDELELKDYYKTYHRKSWSYKKAYINFKRLKLIGHLVSVLTASGGIIGSIVTHGTAIVAVGAAALMIQGYMEHKDLNVKINSCQYAFQSYNQILNEIVRYLRSGNYNKQDFIRYMNQLDSFIIDTTPIIDKYYKKYDDKFLK